MTSKKILLALALILSATSASLAQGARYYYNATPYGYGNSGYGNYGAPYGYGPSFHRYSGYYDVAPTWGNPMWRSDERPDVAQPSPNSGVESQR
jgi:hypothetical protein